MAHADDEKPRLELVSFQELRVCQSVPTLQWLKS